MRVRQVADFHGADCLQTSTTYVMLQKALCSWLSERVDLSLQGDGGTPEAVSRAAYAAALSSIRQQGLLDGFLQRVEGACRNPATFKVGLLLGEQSWAIYPEVRPA